MLSDLTQFDLITARESIIYTALLERGVSANTKLYPDCAFAMKSEEIDLPDGWQEENMIGVNVSPLISSYASKRGIVEQSVSRLVKHILDTTGVRCRTYPACYLEGQQRSCPAVSHP